MSNSCSQNDWIQHLLTCAMPHMTLSRGESTGLIPISDFLPEILGAITDGDMLSTLPLQVAVNDSTCCEGFLVLDLRESGFTLSISMLTSHPIKIKTSSGSGIIPEEEVMN